MSVTDSSNSISSSSTTTLSNLEPKNILKSVPSQLSLSQSHKKYSPKYSHTLPLFLFLTPSQSALCSFVFYHCLTSLTFTHTHTHTLFCPRPLKCIRQRKSNVFKKAKLFRQFFVFCLKL